MRYFLVFLSLLFQTVGTCQLDSTFSFSISGKIPALKQKDDMACWLTVATMMLSWKDSANYDVVTIAEKLGDPWKLYYELNTGLHYKDQKDFIKKIGLQAEQPANYTLLGYKELLQRHGPLWVITGDEIGAHARLITGIEGDGTIGQTEFVLIDPRSGLYCKKKAMIFLQEFEEEARIANEQEARKKGAWPDLRIQLYHF